jgi:hypothetical protein
MNPVIHFSELENRVISATYRNLMIGAKVQLVDKSNGEPVPEPVTKITSPMPSCGSACRPRSSQEITF